MTDTERLVIGIDSSTQSVKAIAWSRDGTPMAEGRATHDIHVPSPLIAEQDARQWWSAAQEALQWTVTPDYDGRELTLIIRDAQGNPAPVKTLEVVVGRPTHVRDDQTPEFTYSGGMFRAPLQLAPGLWNIHLTATAPDGTVFRQRIDHYNGNRVK